MDRMLLAQLEQDPVLRRAAEWFFELRSADVAVERIAEWQDWLTANALNRAAFESIESFWSASGKVASPPWPTDTEVAADRYQGEQSISEWRRRRVGHRRLLQRTAYAALAASIAIAMIVGGWLAFHSPDLEVETRVAETRTFDLPDGSTVSVGGQTRLEATFEKSARELALRRGEAFFSVTKDPQRPFAVHVGDITVTAVGTSFNVRRAGDSAVIAVSEGAVRVSTAASKASVKITAGEQLRVTSRSVPAGVAHVDPHSVAGWREGRLQYTNEPLATVVADLARYSSRRIVLADAAVARLSVTGVVFQQNLDGWLASLETTLPVHVVTAADGSVEIQPRE